MMFGESYVLPEAPVVKPKRCLKRVADDVNWAISRGASTSRVKNLPRRE